MGYHLSKVKAYKTYTSMCYLTDVKETRKQTIKGTKHEKKKNIHVDFNQVLCASSPNNKNKVH